MAASGHWGATDGAFSIVTEGPAYRLLARARLAALRPTVMLRGAVVLALLAWVPLLLLSVVEGLATGTRVTFPFLRDFGAHTRFLLSVPLLLLADVVVGPRLATVVNHFLTAGLIAPEAEPAFATAVERARALASSGLAEGVLLVLAWAGSAWAFFAALPHGVSAWYAVSPEYGTHLTPAGWWYVGIGLPLFQFLVARWLWRGIVWAGFLARVSRLDLRLVATHPDAAGGLGFLAGAQASFAIIEFAALSVFAAIFGAKVVYSGAHVVDFKAPVIAIVVVAIVLPLAPLLVFAGPLGRVRRTAIRSYGALMTAHNRAFETRWIDDPTKGADALGSPDVSSVADLGAVFTNIQQMRTIPIDRASVLSLAVAAVIPMLGLAALEVPLKDILVQVLGILK